MSVKEEKVDRPNCMVLEEALTLMKRAYDLMKQEAVDVRKEKEAFDSVAKKLEHVHFTSTIKLNVGGQSFTTSLQTLTKDTGSMLHAMFSGRFDTKPAEDGSYFIDRDGTHFRYILNYLRTGELVVPEDKIVRKELLSEAEFYQIRGIVDELCPSPFLDSKILSEEQKQIFVNTWLKERLNRRLSTFVLLYRAPRDGWRSSDFHSHCDYRGATVTVVKSGDYIFGGFTEKSWDGSRIARMLFGSFGTQNDSEKNKNAVHPEQLCSRLEKSVKNSSGYKHCTEAFLFGLVNPSGAEPTKLLLKADSGKTAKYCGSSCGPTFGVGHDLFISSEANPNSDSRSKYLNSSYAFPSHATFSTFLTGNECFTVDELEVFVYQARVF